jgi:hypothetical protein
MKLKLLADVHISPITVSELEEGVIVSVEDTEYRVRKLPIG